MKVEAQITFTTLHSPFSKVTIKNPTRMPPPRLRRWGSASVHEKLLTRSFSILPAPKSPQKRTEKKRIGHSPKRRARGVFTFTSLEGAER